MKRKLGSIADIRFGPYLKGADNGDAKYLLASHFDELYQPTRFELSYVDLDQKVKDELLQPNDVILAGKGQRSFAWAYEEDMGPCVPSSLFFVLEANKDELLGSYLAYYLNSEAIQHKLKVLGSGLTIPSIPKKELKNLMMSVPSLEEQKRFVAFAALMDEDIALAESLVNRKKAMSKTILNKMISKLL